MKLLALAATLVLATPAVAQTVTQDSGSTDVQTVDDPKGGYQPTAPLFTAPPTPGAQVVFVPSTLTPDQAYPAPPPKASYPICKPHQFDNCMQRGGR